MFELSIDFVSVFIDNPALFSVLIVVVIGIVGGMIYTIRRVEATETPEFMQLIEQYRQWNNTVTSRQGYLAILYQLDQLSLHVFGDHLHASITRDQFDRLSDQLIHDSINQLLDDIVNLYNQTFHDKSGRRHYNQPRQHDQI